MFTVIFFMFAGLLSGYLFRKMIIRFLSRFIFILIWVLLFFLGYEIGCNKEVVNHFHELGFEAFLIAFFATLGSVTAAKILWKVNSNFSENKNQPKNLFSFSGLKNLKGSLTILSFFCTGLIMGIFQLIPEKFFIPEISFYVLCALMFSVGFSLGHQPETVKNFRNIPKRTLLLPFVTIVGTWLGAVLIGCFFRHSLSESLAVSSGFGYYSLSGILITQYKGAELGAIALLANIFREIFTLVFAPQMVRYFGKLAPIAAGGATTMDTTFPIIIQASGKEFSIISIYSGFILDFSVPFLVTLWCSI